MTEPQDPNEQYGSAYPPPGWSGYGQQPGYSGYPGYQEAPGQAPGAYPGQPGYGPQYPPQGNPQYAPQYAPQYTPQYGPQFPGYPPPVPPRITYGLIRPGLAIASAVLSFVTAGLLLISAIVLFAAASTISRVNDSGDFFDFHDAVTELTVDAVLDLVAGAVLITAGVLLLGRRRIGLPLTLLGHGLTVAYAIYWIARTSSDPGAVSTAVLFIALSAVSVSLAVPTAVRTWLNRTDA